VNVVYDAKKQELKVESLRAPAPMRNGRQSFICYVDRTSMEIYASDGLTYMPLPITLQPQALEINVTAKGGAAKFHSLEAHVLKSIWKN
jgi:hypothetical protein